MTISTNLNSTISGVQFLRFIAALLVVFLHAREIQNKFYPVFADDNLTHYTSFGAFGVHIFFVISGFVMAHTTQTKFGQAGATEEFWFRRFCRIYPPYWVYAALYLSVHTAFFAGYDLSLGQAISALLLISSDASLIIGPGWTLAYEVYFYVCFGIVLLLPKRFGLIALSLYFVCSISLGLIIPKASALYPPYFNPLLLEFLFGAWISRLYEWKIGWLSKLSYLSLLAGIALLVTELIYGYERLPGVVTWGVPGALIVFGVVGLERIGRLPALIRKLSFLGDSSYSLYLSHILVINSMMAWLSKFAISFGNVYIDLIFSVFVAVIVGLLAYKYIELPLINIAKRALERRRLKSV